MSTFCRYKLWQQRVFLSSATIASAFLLLTGCQTVTPSSSTSAADTTLPTSVIQPLTVLTPAVKTVVGDYATDGYAPSDYNQRAQGYDWVGVMVRPFGDAEIDIKVRARSDIKKPSCRFDGKATLMGQDSAHGVIFQTIANGSVMFLQFKEGVLTIDSQDKYALNYFCSGGATLAGNYQKITGNLNFS
ncbi:hypothetical protein ES754_02000 [Psychrobacter frigidicola]|uniref:Lipoprotein n=1 Tax=Psychrobacter frigidicola TaxID=45611 RepID=A0A5C7A327_9GAMM|nr:hypothetical protein [Psychrobacter frigidicola]TXD97771.1 hypothetical protein ES754_02000 [Psychrobacter frigidicola]